MTRYYVYNKDRGKPKHAHNNYDDALREAERLAHKEDVDIEVLKVVAKVSVEKKIIITEYLKEDE